MFSAAAGAVAVFRRVTGTKERRVLLLTVQMGLESVVVTELEGLGIDGIEARPR